MNAPKAPRRRRVSVQTIREAAAAAVANTSLRQVARDAEVSAPVLSAFLAGAEPRDPTLHRLREWYFSEAAARGAPSLASARAALDLLTLPLPPEDQRMARLGVVSTLHRIWTRRGTALPAWLVGLMEELDPPGSGEDAA